ncbi:hypothetical protein [Streptomyces tubercidicus]|uniref:hypothetical protein n=1 Tax=Streptomyces tubercidicus TaxID=47759 RepID=UPI0022B79318|nr:hypothetical protein [Streptomyces tubercidicus]WAU10008.1 hypothetical protein STRTU_000047 [Streptomyces tubercidicus]
MVREPWRGKGEAARIHERLLRDRSEQRATLLVDWCSAASTMAGWGTRSSAR